MLSVQLCFSNKVNVQKIILNLLLDPYYNENWDIKLVAHKCHNVLCWTVFNSKN